MKEIWKYEIFRTDVTSIVVPRGGAFLSAQIQDDKIMLWVLVDPNETKIDRVIHLIGTGRPFDDKDKHYISTVIDGSFVWHLFLES